VTVDALLSKAALAINKEEKLQIMSRIVPLALCKKNHQNQQSALLSVWRKLIKEADVAVKAEPDDEVDISLHDVQPRAAAKQVVTRDYEKSLKCEDLEEEIDLPLKRRAERKLL